MEIKVSSINSVPPQKGLIAFCSVHLIEGDFVMELNNIAIHTRQTGELGITFPARKLGERQYQFYSRPVNKETELKILEAVKKEAKEIKLISFLVEE